MKIAIISDIHANLEALTAVLAHIDAQGDIEAIYCLGDVVGYGPDPEAVTDLIESRCAFTLLGNHDHALLHAPIGFNRVAAGAIYCQRKMMEPGLLSNPNKVRRWEFLRNLPEEKRIDGDLFVHASPRDKIFEYILPEDCLYNPEKVEGAFDMIERRCFIGHTHRPGIFVEGPNFIVPSENEMDFTFSDHEKLIINVSSVGQPRDRDPRACYATVEGNRLRFHRVPYDFETTIRKVQAIEGLDPICGLRLREGK